MNIDEVLNKDYYNGKNSVNFQKILTNIKPFEKYWGFEDVPLDMMEKYVSKCEYKYCLMIMYINPIYIIGERNMYWCDIIRTDTGERIKQIYASSLYELYCKICIYYNYMIKNGIPEETGNKIRK